MSCSNVTERQHSCQQIICNLRENGTGSFSHRPTIIIIIIFIRLKTHKKAQAYKTISEAGCQRGTNTHQCWPPMFITHAQLQIYTLSQHAAYTQCDREVICFMSMPAVFRCRVVGKTLRNLFYYVILLKYALLLS